ncbi:MAG: hypothetical protein WA081_06600 [Desulfosalsimonadaceae bacterium]
MPGFVLPIPFIATGRFIGVYPLKQFAPVIHGNHRIRAASQWAPTGEKVLPFLQYQVVAERVIGGLENPPHDFYGRWAGFLSTFLDGLLKNQISPIF